MKHPLKLNVRIWSLITVLSSFNQLDKVHDIQNVSCILDKLLTRVYQTESL